MRALKSPLPFLETIWFPVLPDVLVIVAELAWPVIEPADVAYVAVEALPVNAP